MSRSCPGFSAVCSGKSSFQCNVSSFCSFLRPVHLPMFCRASSASAASGILCSNQNPLQCPVSSVAANVLSSLLSSVFGNVLCSVLCSTQRPVQCCVYSRVSFPASCILCSSQRPVQDPLQARAFSVGFSVASSVLCSCQYPPQRTCSVQRPP